MKIEDILGRREDQHLEFKSAKVLAKEPENVARAVVGMLNAGGGEIWIGVDDEEDVAVALVPVADPERAKNRLRDYLLETLDPSPIADEVLIELVPADNDPACLLVRVKPQGKESGRLPYAFRRKGGWHFLRRVGARNYPMSRQEVFDGRVNKSADQAIDKAFRSLVEARERFRAEVFGDSVEAGLWVSLQPVRRLELDLEAHKERFDQIALDPSVTGNRRTGWHFARTNRPTRLAHRRLEWGMWSNDSNRPVILSRVREDGALEFWASLAVLHWREGTGGEKKELYPDTILELPVSAFRIARDAYRDALGPDDQVAADLALFGVAGWGLRAGTPGTAYFLASGSWLRRQDEPDLIWEPVSFTFREVEETPDRCGFRLVRRVYHSFGIAEDDMSRHYDRETGRLILPE